MRRWSRRCCTSAPSVGCSPLRHRTRRACSATLRVFLDEGGSLNAAAAKSYVHRNTMLYRLNKIEKVTGLSVRDLRTRCSGCSRSRSTTRRSGRLHDPVRVALCRKPVTGAGGRATLAL